MNNLNTLLSQIEAARLWSYFHKDWLLQIRSAIRRQLPADYRVFIESEVVLVTPDAWELPSAAILPDVSLTRRADERSPAEPGLESTPAVGVIEAEEPCESLTHYSLVIRRAPENTLVAAAELLSPSNKGIGNKLAQQKFLRKRSEYLDAGINLLEIDALTQGERILPDALAALGAYDRIARTAYHDAGRRRYRGCGWNESQPLPDVAWRIDPAQTVHLDLTAALREAAEFNQWEALVSRG